MCVGGGGGGGGEREEEGSGGGTPLKNVLSTLTAMVLSEKKKIKQLNEIKIDSTQMKLLLMMIIIKYLLRQFLGNKEDKPLQMTSIKYR